MYYFCNDISGNMEVTRKSERAFQILTIPIDYMSVTVLYTTFNQNTK
jgi:hypothetical protein